MSDPTEKFIEFQYFDDNFTILKVLGQGAFGKVYKAIDKSTGDACAVKVSKLQLWNTNSC